MALHTNNRHDTSTSITFVLLAMYTFLSIVVHMTKRL